MIKSLYESIALQPSIIILANYSSVFIYLLIFFSITFALLLQSCYGPFHIIDRFVCFQRRLDKLLCGKRLTRYRYV